MYPDIVPLKTPIIVLDINSYVCMTNNFKDTKHTRHIARRVNFVSNGEIIKMHNIDWFGGGLQLADIATKNVGENDLNIRIKYIVVRLYK